MESVSQTSNLIQLQGSMIIVRLKGLQNQKTIALVRSKIQKLFRDPDGFSRVMVDWSEVSQINRPGWQETRQLLLNLPKVKVALVGARPRIKLMLNWLVRTSRPAQSRARLFSGELFAREWLAQRD